MRALIRLVIYDNERGWIGFTGPNKKRQLDISIDETGYSRRLYDDKDSCRIALYIDEHKPAFNMYDASDRLRASIGWVSPQANDTAIAVLNQAVTAYNALPSNDRPAFSDSIQQTVEGRLLAKLLSQLNSAQQQYDALADEVATRQQKLRLVLPHRRHREQRHSGSGRYRPGYIRRLPPRRPDADLSLSGALRRRKPPRYERPRRLYTLSLPARPPRSIRSFRPIGSSRPPTPGRRRPSTSSWRSSIRWRDSSLPTSTV